MNKLLTYVLYIQQEEEMCNILNKLIKLAM